jgi:sialic acid synthase SpsE
MSVTFLVGERALGTEHSTYFIADIAANHDGDLERAKELVYLAADAGANAAKFQHFEAGKIVSDHGFRSLGDQKSHQSKWSKSVFDTYVDAEVPRSWTKELKRTCDEAGIHFFSAPYDFSAVDLLEKNGVPAHKIGSGDITWTDMLERIGQSGLPVFLASGASEITDVIRAVEIFEKYDVPLCLMQCNTNYTGALENFKHVHLNVLKTYASLFPKVLLGLSDHTPGHATVLGAVALGARAIEKHFTDDVSRKGPDHKFSMTPVTWRDMVDRTRELEASLGSSRKFVAANEKDTVVLQRRCLRAARKLKAGTNILEEHIVALRPAPLGALMPYDIEIILGRAVSRDIDVGEHITLYDVD